LLSDSISENNAQITQLQTQIQSLESEMIDVEQLKHQDL
jgi:Tfp pilus assembly protein PilN